MSILTFLIVVLIIGLLLYFFNAYAQLPPPVKTIINIVFAIIIIAMLLSVTGILSGNDRLGRLPYR